MKQEPPRLAQRRRTWSTNNPLFWNMYATQIPGRFTKREELAFETAGGKYILFCDHRYAKLARDFVQTMLETHDVFIAGKVTKIARDGELAIILLAPSSQYSDYVKSTGELFGCMLWKYKTDLESKTDQEDETNKRWREYIIKLAAGLRID